MEMESPPLCPTTVTVRRNPTRKARYTPFRERLFSPTVAREILTDEVPPAADAMEKPLAENLKMYLRIRPMTVQKKSRNVADSRNVWPKNSKTKCSSNARTNKSSEICLHVNEDLRSVTVANPQALPDAKRTKSEVYEGFTHVFAPEALQSDVYEMMVKPLVEDFIKGKSGMLAAVGPTGSGKTHTVFGSTRDPGMVSLSLRHIFRENRSMDRVYHLSIWEISSEKGKIERITDLLQDGQQSSVKGLKEAVVCDAQQAESLIAQGMLKRATATTNSNSQSSRSQCIITMRYDSIGSDDKVNSTMFTIVDLAGAEREKRTGNLGARLLESNFINNTSMVFSLCLRSLLEHQKNPAKPLPKHYQNSMLTRYLRDYLEGKKRMALILTVKSGMEDYGDTSLLLRQASPFTRIKFEALEEQSKTTCNKRQNDRWPIVEQPKKIKLSENVASKRDELDKGTGLRHKEDPGEAAKNSPTQTNDGNGDKLLVQSDGYSGLVCQEASLLKEKCQKTNAENDREFKITLGLSKAIWTVLKEFKKKLQDLGMENSHLRESLAEEHEACLDLQNNLISERKIRVDLENELKELNSRCECHLKAGFQNSSKDASPNHLVYETAQYQKGKSKFIFEEMEQSTEKQCDTIDVAGCAVVVSDDEIANIQDSSESGDSVTKSYGPNEVFECDDAPCDSDLSVDAVTERNNRTFIDDPVLPVVCPSLDTNNQSKIDLSGNSTNMESESEVVSGGSDLYTSLQNDSSDTSQCWIDPTNSSKEPKQQDTSRDECASQIENLCVPVTIHSDAVVSSSEIPIEREKSHDDNDTPSLGRLQPQVTDLPEDGFGSENTSTSCHNSQHKAKPKRRLVPASALLVKNMNVFDLKNADDKPRGVKKQTSIDDKSSLTQGSLSLLNLLTSKLEW